MAQGELRALEVPEAGGALEDTDGEEEHQESIADAHQGIVDAGDDAPDVPALEGVWGLGQQGPYLGQLAVPAGQSVFQEPNDPVVTDRASPPAGRICVSR